LPLLLRVEFDLAPAGGVGAAAAATVLLPEPANRQASNLKADGDNNGVEEECTSGVFLRLQTKEQYSSLPLNMCIRLLSCR
jgi:hypothetical protein